MTETEKIAFASIVTSMMCADFEITFDENCYFNELKYKLSLTDEIIDKARNTSKQSAIDILKGSSSYIKNETIFILCKMATFGDGLTKEKNIMIRDTCIAWGIPLESIFDLSKISYLMSLKID
ncbi:MAG: hypothetical protein ACK5M3_18510 [Dysgonomonas sp.]